MTTENFWGAPHTKPGHQETDAATREGAVNSKERAPISLSNHVDEWNSKFPVGTPVTYYRVSNPFQHPVVTVTRSKAWVMSGHSAMVMVAGISGGVALTHVFPRLDD